MILPAKEARKLVEVCDPRPALVWKDGEPIDEDGTFDKRLAKPHVWCLGPFGSWPDEDIEAIDEKFEEHDTWVVAKSLRLGPCVLWDRGWGYAISQGDYDRLMAEHAAAVVGTTNHQPDAG